MQSVEIVSITGLSNKYCLTGFETRVTLWVLLVRFYDSDLTIVTLSGKTAKTSYCGGGGGDGGGW